MSGSYSLSVSCLVLDIFALIFGFQLLLLEQPKKLPMNILFYLLNSRWYIWDFILTNLKTVSLPVFYMFSKIKS